MPKCPHPGCLREELPTAPAMPAGVPVPVAHAMPGGEPCPLSFGEVYNDEARELIFSEDALWELDVAPIAPAAPPLLPTTKKPAKGRKRAQRAKDDVDDWEP